ncbi:Antilisterial bacteriocin subtilosin biosynthesis protein AlbA [Enhygromyxa salina]|uniref:Antilisterial bacteriocin subtilosin biosynthesis protein AlbA n=1 Tax=Enhygromyxa salina TaxID=215803 RepID=A0A2S9XD97_9BACT|nr:radical SAM protein [Enhygromyxa salina]PRP90740.1 Antilisterial bacteriocin subtilosin biosynthesis protein AlbA [Enhygromyxa salina]
MPSPRVLRDRDVNRPRPIYTVWEITLRCDHACAHCGSRAGPVRDDELDTAELLAVADALVELGSREVTLIGGEAYLRSDVYELVEHLAKAGIRVTMQTGGRGLTAARAQRLRDAGLAAIGVSIDGTETVHDTLRASPGSHAAAIRAIENARAAGMIVTSNSQINQLNMHELPEIAAELEAAGVLVWRGQLTAPMGRAADHPEWIIQPYMVLDIIDTLAKIQAEAAARAEARGVSEMASFRVTLGNNLGYYGRHEQLLRSRPDRRDRFFPGCQAGRYVLGIESDGTVKGCPSLPTAPYQGGNVRELSLEQIWEGEALRFTRDRTTDELWGHCASCYYADVCRAGCSFTSHSTLGRRGNNPFCYYRADKLRKQGVREVIVHARRAPGAPYDFGGFELREQPWSDELPAPRRSLPVLS